METTEIEIEIPIGEDFACQIFWASEYNEPIKITDPAIMDVKDGNGQIAMRFSVTTDPLVDAHITVGANGFFQLTAPAVLTRLLVPGRYLCDLWACVADSATPFDRQLQQVVSGYVLALPRVTRLEDVSGLFITEEVGDP